MSVLREMTDIVLQATHPFLLPKTSTFSDVADALSKLVELSPNGTGKIKIFDISPNGRQQRECTSSEMIANLREPAELFGEVSRTSPSSLLSLIRLDSSIRKYRPKSFGFLIMRR